MKETYLQIQIAQLIDLDFLPEDLLWYAVPNGANLPKKKNKKGKWWSPEGHKLKQMGMKAGATDFVFHWPVPGERWDTGVIEIKTGDGDLSDDQEVFRQRVVSMRGRYAIARCYEKVRDTLVAWGARCSYRVRL